MTSMFIAVHSSWFCPSKLIISDSVTMIDTQMKQLDPDWDIYYMFISSARIPSYDILRLYMSILWDVLISTQVNRTGYLTLWLLITPSRAKTLHVRNQFKFYTIHRLYPICISICFHSVYLHITTIREIDIVLCTSQ
jgi:hypothetical protein